MKDIECSISLKIRLLKSFRSAHFALLKVSAKGLYIYVVLNLHPALNKSVLYCRYGGKGRNAFVAVYDKPERDHLDIIDMIRLNLRNKHDRLFIVKYIRWQNTHMYPLGYVCKVIPAGSDLKTSQVVLNLQYQVPMKYSEEALNMTDFKYAKGIPELFLDGRESMQNMTTVSIDPVGCRDIDDALSVKCITKYGKGDDVDIYEVTIHISDVSQFLSQNDSIDNEARRRMTSYYPAGKQCPIHMLPDKLSEDLCSLIQGQERLALSVTITMDDENGKVDEDSVVSGVEFLLQMWSTLCCSLFGSCIQ